MHSVAITTTAVITAFLLHSNEQFAVSGFPQASVHHQSFGHRVCSMPQTTSTSLQVISSTTLARGDKMDDVKLSRSSSHSNGASSKVMKSRRKVDLSKPRMLRPKGVGSKSRLDSVIPASTLPTKNRRKSSSVSRLSREEEVEVSNAIRGLRAVVRIRDTLSDPTEEEWAGACNLAVQHLRQVMQSGQDARTKLVSANVGLVMSIAKRYYAALKRATSSGGGVGTILTLNDLIQEGNLGLMEAAERFEPSRGFRFGTYATWWVRQRMLRSIDESSRIIRLPGHVHTMLRKVKKEEEEMEEELGRPPSIPELAHRLEIPVQKLQLYTHSSRSVLSLEVPTKNTDRRTLGDKIASNSPSPVEVAEFDSLREEIRAVVEGLNPNERDVLVSRFGLDDGAQRTVEETARSLGISRDRVRTVEARAINKLRHPQRHHRLKEFVAVEVESEKTEVLPEKIWSF